ncbi:polysaccharide biosynthesis/export family protein [Qipengyuania spongiae]|uniref:Polysaccharide export protein n=1 Tax=Qipengyuania spongiae TaxID=2909673 RepID=A0ABY5T156_9SPHN|nr:polysaccharide biosynthesis/export family protein [Qipengyuania spongiae]UVI39061.1 polysaccharide export protein [Qipengyuania spongiae]
MSQYFKKALPIIALALTAPLMGCGGSIPPPGTAAYQPVEYQLAAGDRLRITVFGEESLSREYTVSSAGDLSFPLLGDLPVAGKTVTQLQSDIASGLSQGYLNDPRVNAEVLNYRPFYILGEVTRAGEYPFSDDLTVQQAVALAGGYSYRANQNEVYIRRRGSDQEETYELSSQRRVFIAPGDTIRVGERYF